MYGPSWLPENDRVTLAFDPGALVAFRYLTRVLQRLLGDENGFALSSGSCVNPLGRSLSTSNALVSSPAVRVTDSPDVPLGADVATLGADVVPAGVEAADPLFLSSPPQPVRDRARAAARASGNDTNLVMDLPEP